MSRQDAHSAEDRLRLADPPIWVKETTKGWTWKCTRHVCYLQPEGWILSGDHKCFPGISCKFDYKKNHWIWTDDSSELSCPGGDNCDADWEIVEETDTE